jgi:predicted RNA-binding Zn ribbon-like protein
MDPMQGEIDEAERQASAFEFSGGLPCLDFVNTLSGRLKDRPRERLRVYSDLISWGRQAGLLTDLEAQRLIREARRRPAQAATVLERAVGLREALYRLFSVAASGRVPNEDDLAALNAVLSVALSRSRIVLTDGGFGWDWADREDSLERALWPVARSAAQLLTSGELARVRECAETSCAWLFLDTSRNRSRQWCDMRACGNRAKARRHYARRKLGR